MFSLYLWICKRDNPTRSRIGNDEVLHLSPLPISITLKQTSFAGFLGVLQAVAFSGKYCRIGLLHLTAHHFLAAGLG